MKRDFRYTSDTVFDTFPWPQAPNEKQILEVAGAGVALRAVRARVMTANKIGLRELYRTLELPGDNPLKAAQATLNTAVRAAYGMGLKEDPLQFLLDLNQALAVKEENEEAISGPGLPPSVTNPMPFITADCITP